MAQTQGSELVAFFTDYDDPKAPFDGPALRVTITADLAFLAIGKLTSGREGDTFACDDATQTVGVDVELLYQTLGAMIRRADRRAHDQLTEGELPADHPALTTVDRILPVPATRVRA